MTVGCCSDRPEGSSFTPPGSIAQKTAWFDRHSEQLDGRSHPTTTDTDGLNLEKLLPPSKL
ncbi:MAG: hypothetical protein U7126_20045 [Microcoleus sp.]